jgi:hypothetical protein
LDNDLDLARFAFFNNSNNNNSVTTCDQYIFQQPTKSLCELLALSTTLTEEETEACNNRTDCLAIDCDESNLVSLSSSSSITSATSTNSSTVITENQQTLTGAESSEDSERTNSVAAATCSDDDDVSNTNQVDAGLNLDSSNTSLTFANISQPIPSHFKSRFRQKETRTSSSLLKKSLNLQPAAFLNNDRVNSPSASSSSECLSCDEGYVGSYSDSTRMSLALSSKSPSLAQQDKESLLIKCESQQYQELVDNNNILSQEQFLFLQYLAENNYFLHETDKNGATSKPFDSGDSTDLEDFKIPSLFKDCLKSPDNENEAVVATMLDLNELENDLATSHAWIYANSDKPTSFETENLMTESVDEECAFDMNEFKLALDAFESVDETEAADEDKDIVTLMMGVARERQAQFERDEAAMNNWDGRWRQVLEERESQARKHAEWRFEDHVDLDAYLNEIELNVDVYNTECESGCVHDSLQFDMDQMLRFVSARHACNVRMYHAHVTDQQQRLKQRRQVKPSVFGMNVDLIPEFVPVPQQFAYQQLHQQLIYGSTEFDYDNSDELGEYYHDEQESNFNNGELLYGDGDNSIDRTLGYNEADTTVVMMSLNEMNAADADKNGYVYDVDGGEMPVQDFYGAVTQGEDMVNYDANAVYYDEDYEDAYYVDGLTEEEALHLLRTESEMYALQMAQAAKLGLLPSSNNSGE